jgi:translation elongation factor EF-1alpha
MPRIVVNCELMLAPFGSAFLFALLISYDNSTAQSHGPFLGVSFHLVEVGGTAVEGASSVLHGPVTAQSADLKDLVHVVASLLGSTIQPNPAVIGSGKAAITRSTHR